MCRVLSPSYQRDIYFCSDNVHLGLLLRSSICDSSWQIEALLTRSASNIQVPRCLGVDAMYSAAGSGPSPARGLLRSAYGVGTSALCS